MFGKKQKTIFAASRYKWLPERNPGLLIIQSIGETGGKEGEKKS